LSGILEYGYSEAFVGFENTYVDPVSGTVDEEKLMRKLGRANFSVDYWWHPNWATGFGYSDVRNDYKKGLRPYDRYNAQQASLNLTFRPSTGNQIVLSVSAEQGEYPEQDKSEGSLREWKRNDVRLSGQWRLSGVTQANGYIGYAKRKYEYASNRDFSGITGSIGFQWTPTGKAIIGLSWRREIGADVDNLSNYAVTKGWSLQPTWVITSKVRLGASYERLERKYGGNTGVSLPWWYPLFFPTTKDAKTTVYGLNLQFQPTASSNIALGFMRDKRDADAEVYGYRARMWTLSGNLTF
jgi:hypothetical protein